MQTEQQRKQLLEEQQIARMILSLQQCRDESASLTGENTRLNDLVVNLDRQIANLHRISDEHAKAADDRAKAIELHKQAEASFKASMDDVKKEIDRLNRKVSLWRKVTVGAFLFGVLLGFSAKN